jgi:hypothetical protein
MNLQEFEAIDWYTWRCVNWGTKWDADNSCLNVRFVEDYAAVIDFDTAWTPPMPVIMRLGQLYPEYRFRLTWHEINMDMQGRLDVHGEKVKIKEYDSFSVRRERNDLSSVVIPARMPWKPAGKQELTPPLPASIEEFLGKLESSDAD